jgi:hypothetical protein
MVILATLLRDIICQCWVLTFQLSFAVCSFLLFISWRPFFWRSYWMGTWSWRSTKRATNAVIEIVVKRIWLIPLSFFIKIIISCWTFSEEIKENWKKNWKRLWERRKSEREMLCLEYSWDDKRLLESHFKIAPVHYFSSKSNLWFGYLTIQTVI